MIYAPTIPWSLDGHMARHQLSTYLRTGTMDLCRLQQATTETEIGREELY